MGWASVAAAILVAMSASTPLPAGSTKDDSADPSVCRPDRDGVLLCVWDWEFFPRGPWDQKHWMVPSRISTSIVDVRISTNSAVTYVWGFCLEPMPPNGGPKAPCPSGVIEEPQPPAGLNRTSTVLHTLLTEFDPADHYHFMIHPSILPTFPTLVPATFHVEGRFHEVKGYVPARGHAGTPEDPQLRDNTGDASIPAGEITGGWFDQAYLDDGLLEAGLVLPNLRDLRDDTDAAFTLSFDVLGHTYTIRWEHGPPEKDNDRVKGWKAVLYKARAQPTRHMYALPMRIDNVNGHIAVLIPLRALGEPKDGELFTNFSARSFPRILVGALDFGVGPFDDPDLGALPDDTANIVARPFATGGPRVWDRLRGIPGDADAASTAPAPPRSLFPTLLVVGLGAAAIASAGALLVVRRRPRAVPAGRASSVAPGALILEKYRVERELGAGSGGRAFLAQDVRMNRSVVLKVLASRDHADAVREARAVAAVDHPNVVRVYGIEDLGPDTLIVMEFVSGGSLKERIGAGGGLSSDGFARVATDLLLGLEAVHAAGFVHRDIKPGNVLVTRDGHAKISDFGIARLPGFEMTLGSVGLGSVQYMSPEQARGRRVTPRSDLYSAAATLYEACTGRALVQPLAGETATETQIRVGAGRTFHAPIEPRALRAWFARALAGAPEKRFATAAEMRAALPSPE